MDLPPRERVEVSDVGPVRRASASTAGAIVAAAWEAFHNEIHGFLLRTTRSAPEAEDLTQETFLRLTRSVGAGDEPEQLRAWLYRVAANLAVSRGRRWTVARRWFATASERYEPETAQSVESTYLVRERAAALDRALATLDRDGRVALLLSAQGVPAVEIAAAIHRSPNATRTLMCRARLKVRQAMAAGGEA